MQNKIRYLILLPLFVYTIETNCPNNQTNLTLPIHNDKSVQNITFKDYLQKFNPSHVWEKIDRRNKLAKVNKTVKEEFDAMFNGIDETDDLLKLRVQNGNPKIVLEKDGRKRWSPPPSYSHYHDRYSLKPRIMELVKHAIYQTRYKMAIMQILREKYRKSPVYKMGFLMSKADVACKNFAKFSFKIIKDCTTARQAWFYNLPVVEVLSAQERMLNMWFEVELLVDLVIKNDENCKRMLEEVMTNRKHAWKFYD